MSVGVTSDTFRNRFLVDRLTVGGGSTLSSVVKSTISCAGADVDVVVGSCAGAEAGNGTSA